jgi:membrane protein implicated in regulation of membrane protease activity
LVRFGSAIVNAYWKLALYIVAGIAVGLGALMVSAKPAAYPAYGLVFAGLAVLSVLAGEATVRQFRRANKRDRA